MDDSQRIIDENNQKANAAADVVSPSDLPDSLSQGVRTKGDGDITRIVVDRLACIGARSCVVVAEGVFEMDDQNLAYVKDPDALDQETVKLAAEACPVLAIHLYNKKGKKLFPEA